MEFKQKVKLALQRKGFPTQKALVEHLGWGKNTVSGFFTCKKIDYSYFVEICQTLDLDWQEIADLEDASEEDSQETICYTTEQSVSVTVDGGENADFTSESRGQTDTKKEKRFIGFETMPEVPMWFGRDELLEELKGRMLPPTENAGPKVLAIVGQGGIGKTSLAIKLLRALGGDGETVAQQSNSFFDLYLFYRVTEGNSFDDGAGFLLRGLGLSAADFQTPEDKIAAILRGLNGRRCLLLLDNLESILQPASHSEAGKAVSPEWGRLLHDLVFCNHRSRGILTSRELPLDLADPRSRRRQPDPKLVSVEPLGGVADEDGVRILREYGLTDSEEDLRWVAARVKGNVFLLGQLGAIARDCPGYLRQHAELVTEEAEPIIQEQLQRQTEAGRELLRRMSVLRVGVDLQGLTFLRLYTGEEEKDERLLMAAGLAEPVEFSREEVRETEAIVEKLVGCSLVQRGYDGQKCEFFYDLHRLIREFLLVESASQIETLQMGACLFHASCMEVENPQSLEDLRPALEAQFFAFALGEYGEAADIIMDRLEDYLKPWGHWSLLQDLYQQILPHVAEEDKSRWLRVIGCIYRDYGDWDTAERYFRDALELCQNEAEILAKLGRKQNRVSFLFAAREQDTKSGIATSLGMLGDIERYRGNWDEAENLYRQSLELRTELGDRSGMASTWASLGYIQQCRGNWDEAENLYRQSLELMTELGDRSGMTYSWGVLGDIQRKRGNWDEAENLYRQSLDLRTELGDRSGMATSIGSLGENELARGNLDAAEQLLTEALTMFEEIGMPWHITETNWRLAQLWHRRGNVELAQQHYNTARQMFEQLGAKKDLERIEREWEKDNE